MDYCPLCGNEDIELVEEIIQDDDGLGVDLYYGCEECGCLFVEHSFIEILKEGRWN